MTTNAGRLRFAASLCLPMLLAGCVESAYVYRPAEQATATIEGTTAARYLIPPEAPAGDVRIASFGLMDIEQPERDREIAALHVRLVVSNDAGQKTWVLDTRQVRAELRGAGDAGVPLVSAGSGGLPLVQIQPGKVRTIDFFYPLPTGMDEPDRIPAFDVVWKVETDSRLVAERTPFERIEIEPAPPPPTYVVPGVGWYGPYWWYDPWYYPSALIVRPSVIVTSPASPPRVTVRPRHRMR